MAPLVGTRSLLPRVLPTKLRVSVRKSHPQHPDCNQNCNHRRLVLRGDRDPPRRLLKIGGAHDVVAIEDRARLVPADLHGHALGLYSGAWRHTLGLLAGHITRYHCPECADFWIYSYE